MSYNLPAPRRITASNLPLPSSHANDEHAEPGVEVKVDTLQVDSVLDGLLMRARVATAKQLPTSNDGHGDIPLDEVPGMGIVLPGGMNMYYLDVKPNTEGTMVRTLALGREKSPFRYYTPSYIYLYTDAGIPQHRTTSTDYLVVISGTLSLMTPDAKAYRVENGTATYGEPIETVCRPGDIVAQRGPMHALSNRTDEWVRVLAVVLASDTNNVPTGSGHKELADAWLA
ncbi:hypothetical protein F4780DRAFT_738166 [Xylariomycetidae sp. FL0641]|nr:hypothetical protein F4780DRAFT_738166 [Xylariomycetidae sp. FL0641]